jgi:phosphatidylserine/phosphatidylglycerophosphate/cardiolipin synthase-like enzyme
MRAPRPSSASGLLLLVAALLAGCGSGGGGGDDDGDDDDDDGDEVDAAPGAADAGPSPDARESESPCDPYALRATPPQVLIGPSPFEDILLGRIAAATTSVDVLMYEFTRESFIDALIDAHGRGVAVRVMVDPDLPANSGTRQTLSAAGIDVRGAPAGFEYAHAKMLVLDDAEAVIMSANLVWSHFEIARNYGVITTDPEDVADAVAIFDADWGGSSPDLYCTRLVVSPANGRQRILDHIRNARESVLLAVMYLKDEDVIGAVKGRLDDGLDVRVLLPDPSWIPDADEQAVALGAEGIPVRHFERWDLHAKLIIADGVPLVGSTNMSWTSLNKNREVGLFVTEPGPRGEIVEQFEADWAIGVSP